MNRRVLLLASIALPLAACTIPTTPSQAASDAALIAQALSAEAPEITAWLPNAAAATAAQKAIDAVTEAANALVSAIHVAAPLVQQLIEAVQALANIILPLAGVPGKLASVIQAALAVLPSLAAAAQLSLDRQSVQPMPAASARLILAAAAHG